MSPGAVSAADGFAMSMVVILVLSLATVTLVLLKVVRSGKAKDTEIDELLDEIRRDEEAKNRPVPPGTGSPKEPWERETDWWKND